MALVIKTLPAVRANAWSGDADAKVLDANPRAIAVFEGQPVFEGQDVPDGAKWRALTPGVPVKFKTSMDDPDLKDGIYTIAGVIAGRDIYPDAWVVAVCDPYKGIDDADVDKMRDVGRNMQSHVNTCAYDVAACIDEEYRRNPKVGPDWVKETYRRVGKKSSSIMIDILADAWINTSDCVDVACDQWAEQVPRGVELGSWSKPRYSNYQRVAYMEFFMAAGHLQQYAADYFAMVAK